MGLSTDVRLPKDQFPQFPDRCVVCGQEKPDGTVRVSTRAIGWWTLHFWPGSKFTVEAPACSWCAVRLRRQHLFRWLTTIALAAVGVIGVMPFLADFKGLTRKWLAISAILVVMLPWFLWQTFFPPPLDLTAYSDSVAYEFRDRPYAEEFAALNNSSTDAEPEEEEKSG